jgi:hypothetical protein
MIVDCAAYHEGERLPGELPIAQAFTASCQQNACLLRLASHHGVGLPSSHRAIGKSFRHARPNNAN